MGTSLVYHFISLLFDLGLLLLVSILTVCPQILKSLYVLLSLSFLIHIKGRMRFKLIGFFIHFFFFGLDILG